MIDKPIHSKHGFIAVMACNEDVSARTSRANARRIVACVNACEGMETEHLENQSLLDRLNPLKSEVGKLTKQRDQLLAALEAHEKFWIIREAELGELSPEAKTVRDNGLAAIAAAKQHSNAMPEGWQWVPVEPTREMIDAAILVEEDGYAAMHYAMLAAAPKLGDE